MTFRNKIYVTIFGILEFIAVLFFLGLVAARAAEASDNAGEQEIVAGPEQHEIRLVSFDPWVVEGEVMGAVATYVYDDVTTERPADYWEIYNQDGELLAVIWFDSLGVRKTAVDRGIVEEKDKLEGVFVVVLDGDLT
ncbi:MAG TPA: hypothetical protein VEQ38_21475 [Verrucomicrobiae bacterium]|nr:hypothetical protein [Verrucomicrobiae bacterium]